jgi:hypothetical protein
LRQAYRAVLPIELDAFLSGISVPVRNGADNLMVLLDRGPQLIENRACVQAPVALGLRLCRTVQFEQARPGARLDDRTVKGHVEIEDTVRIPTARFL